MSAKIISVDTHTIPFGRTKEKKISHFGHTFSMKPDSSPDKSICWQERCLVVIAVTSQIRGIGYPFSSVLS